MNELKRLKEMAGLKEGGPVKNQQTAQELNGILKHLGFIGMDFRNTKESLEQDGGKKIIDYCQVVIRLVREINHNPNG